MAIEGATKIDENSYKINPVFARHETFHPRFGWLKKGYDKVREDQEVFSKENAPVVLGVGKNMVKAIKYWCIAFKIIEEKRVKEKKSYYELSSFASKLLGSDGWDPYIENPSSLWLLHWNLFKSPCDTPVWYFTFNEFNEIEFMAEDLIFSLRDFKDRTFPLKKVSDSSFTKDVNCLLRMYVEKNSPKILKEDSLDCPFAELGLITAYSDSKRYAFNFGNKSTLAPEIIVYACLDFSASIYNDTKTVSTSRLLYDAGSPGQVFKLNESYLCEAIEQVAKDFKEITLTDTAGMIQFAFTEQPEILSEKVLRRFYN